MFESRKRHHPISQRPFRRIALLALLFVPAAFSLASDWPRSTQRPVLGAVATISVTPIALDASDARRTRVGALTWLGGWQIESPDPAFGSISSMAIVPEGLLLLSDAGGAVWLTLDGDGRPTERARFADLPGGPEAGSEKWHRDSEAMALDPRGRSAWVAFERVNEIWRYSSDLLRVQARASPPSLRDWPLNSGAEALVRLGSRRFLVFAERAEPAPGSFAAVAFDRDPTDPAAKATPFLHRPPSGFRTTDGALLRDGRVLLLHRRIGVRPFLSAKLTVIDPALIRRDEIVSGDEIASLAPPLAVDNMEALAVGEEAGRTIVWIASDDNFGAPYQHTLLLKFALDDAR